MKISYNWLKQYIAIDLKAEEVGTILTDIGLEVEAIETVQSVKGGLQGIVVGEVKTKEKHPDADRLSVTTVDVGAEALLNIVCGAANVAAGQKVAVAVVGATLYPTTGESFQIKKSKIRGQLSEGMICAEDEIGLGASHEGIMVLDAKAKVGTPAAEYFKLENDFIFEIGLTPNRVDAASHIGVARDLVAAIGSHLNKQVELKLPDVRAFKTDNLKVQIKVEVADVLACPRYSGVTITDIQVKDSPEWLQKKITAIGLKPINNIVDITNYVLHETGQPLHAFDADKIKGGTVVVKKCDAGAEFVTLDNNKRKLTANDLMICNTQSPMCIAGVFGGIESGVSATTQNIFLESAYFDAATIRKTAKHHGLKTDASFRYERGADPNITVYALKRAALLMKEIAGGNISSEIVDLYPTPIENKKVAFSFENCDRLVGQAIDREVIKNILRGLQIEIVTEGNDALLLSIPPFKPDVTREADVVEEVLRIYGYNNIAIPDALRSSLMHFPKPDKEKVRNTVAKALEAIGFNEIMNNSLTKSEFATDGHVALQNPLSNDLGVMRQTLLYGGLESVLFNINRKNNRLKLFEFGKTYQQGSSEQKQNSSAKALPPFTEKNNLALFITGDRNPELWNTQKKAADFYYLKGVVNVVLERLGINYTIAETDDTTLQYGMRYVSGKDELANFGSVAKSILKKFDIKQEVYYAHFNWDKLVALSTKNNILFKEVPKYPEVRRDLALLVDENIRYQQLEQLAYQTDKKLLKQVVLFDVYKGDKIEAGKKSYALSFTFLDETATLNDFQVDSLMQKLIKTYEEKAGAKIR